MTKIEKKKFLQVMWVFYLWSDLDRRLVRYTDKLLTLDKVISYGQFSTTVLCITTLYTRIIWRTFYLIFWELTPTFSYHLTLSAVFTSNSAYPTCKMFVVYYSYGSMCLIHSTVYGFFHKFRIWHNFIWLNIATLLQIMACRVFGAKPLSTPMLSYCQLDLK